MSEVILLRFMMFTRGRQVPGVNYTDEWLRQQATDIMQRGTMRFDTPAWRGEAPVRSAELLEDGLWVTVQLAVAVFTVMGYHFGQCPHCGANVTVGGLQAHGPGTRTCGKGLELVRRHGFSISGVEVPSGKA